MLHPDCTCKVEDWMEGKLNSGSVMTRPQSCGCICSNDLKAHDQTGFSTSQLTR
jgi:hypothetical protein